MVTAAQVMGEFQRTKVIPEIDAYRYSKIAALCTAKERVGYGYTATAVSYTHLDVYKRQ